MSTQTIFNALTVFNTLVAIWVVVAVGKSIKEDERLTQAEFWADDLIEEGKRDRQKAHKATKLRGAKSPKAKATGKSRTTGAWKTKTHQVKEAKKTVSSKAKEESRPSLQQVHPLQRRKEGKR